MSVLIHASASAEAIRPLSNDERRAAWAARYFSAGYHRIPSKPRVRLSQSTTERAGRIAGKESNV